MIMTSVPLERHQGHDHQLPGLRHVVGAPPRL